MAFGVDYVQGPTTARLHEAGVTFACRYLSEINHLTKSKLLSAPEAKILGDAGISIVSNYEWYEIRAKEGFDSGVHDARIAAQQHRDCGGPDERPIYFSVDCDCDGSQVADYFRGVVSVLGLERTGAYGSYRVIQYLLNDNLIKWAWQTYAWSNGKWDPRAHIRQYSNGERVADASVDFDCSMSPDFGQWKPGEALPQPIFAITHPWVAAHFTQISTNPTRWYCKTTKKYLFAGILHGWQMMNGAPRLPIGDEVQVPGKKRAVYQQCESGILLYDPDRELDAPNGPWAPCYLLKLESELAQKLLGMKGAIPVDSSELTSRLTNAAAALEEAQRVLGETSPGKEPSPR